MARGPRIGGQAATRELLRAPPWSSTVTSLSVTSDVSCAPTAAPGARLVMTDAARGRRASDLPLLSERQRPSGLASGDQVGHLTLEIATWRTYAADPSTLIKQS